MKYEKIFSHPDYTVGYGITPYHAHNRLAGLREKALTAGRETLPAPKTAIG